MEEKVVVVTEEGNKCERDEMGCGVKNKAATSV